MWLNEEKKRHNKSKQLAAQLQKQLDQAQTPLAQTQANCLLPGLQLCNENCSQCSSPMIAWNDGNPVCANTCRQQQLEQQLRKMKSIAKKLLESNKQSKQKTNRQKVQIADLVIINEEQNRRIKQLQQLSTQSESEAQENNRNHSIHVCCAQFQDWLSSVVRLPVYMHAFESHQLNDIRYLEFFEDSTLKNELQIGNALHRKMILRKARIIIDLQSEFEQWLNEASQLPLKRFQPQMEMHGILTIQDLKTHSQSEQELCQILGIDGSINHNHQRREMQMLWHIIQDIDKNHNNNNSVAAAKEGFNSNGTKYH